MPFQIYLTDDASRDLEDLYDYIESHDVPGKADYVLDQIEKAFSSLSETPERGAYPKELLAVGLREYLEIFFKPYRVSIHKWPICPIPVLRSKFYPRNIRYMPAVKFFARLGLDQIFRFLDGHYRIIYRVKSEEVYVMVIADGRRDMQALLQRRLLQA